MTINIVRSSEQHGKKYKAMAELRLPSLWSPEKIPALQTGLAKAIATYFSLSPGEVHVITTVVESGMVVESGEEVHW